jgi:integration host factor subunit alpha
MSKTITRADIAEVVYQQLGISYAESSDLVDATIEEIVSGLARGEEVKLSSFGTFSIRSKKPRMGRNPKTKKEIPISARRVVSFHASNLLAKKINGITE